MILALLALNACEDGLVAGPSDARVRDSAGDVTTVFDGTTPLDTGVSIDAGGEMDVPSPMDVPVPRDVTVMDVRTDTGVAPLPCDPRFVLVPRMPGDDSAFEVRFTDPTGWANIGLDWAGPRTPSWMFVDVVTRDPFTWLFRVQPTQAGRYTVTFTADSGARRLGSCSFDVQPRGGVTDSGVPPRDTGVSLPDSSTPPAANRFGIGLVGPGNPSQLDAAANLAGPGGYVKLIFAGVRPGMTGPTTEWSNAVRDAYARDLIPVVRFGPDWGDRRVRNQSDSGSNARRYTQLAAAYTAIVRGLPLRRGWPFYVEIHNETNLCYEWQCDPGSVAGNWITQDQIAGEYAAMVRDVASAVRAIGNPDVRVINGGLAPGGVRRCMCVGTRDAGAGEWEGGATSLDFIRAMNTQTPGWSAQLDGWASHAYPARGRGFGFFFPYAECSVGLRYFNDELMALGRALPVFLTETGWSTDRDGGGTNSRDDIATWTRQAYTDVWLVDPAVRAVMPFMLQDPSWERFAWIQGSGAPYPVYNAVRSLRCSRIPGRCP